LLVHGLIDELLHLVNFLGSGEAFVIDVHDLFANGGVAGKNRDVESGMKLLDIADPGDERPGRVAVGPLDGGGDALGDLRFGERIGEQPIGGVIVNVNEAGSEDQTVRVDHGFVFLRLQVANFDDVIENDADIHFAERSAGAVGELRMDDDERDGLLLWEERKKGDARDGGHKTNCGDGAAS
jgi:hypothetical protein